MVRTLFSFMLLFFSFVFAQAQIMMHPNRGQWDDRIGYKVELDMGEMLIENQGVTYHLYDWKPSHHCDEHQNCTGHADSDLVRFHVVKSHFVGSQKPSATLEEKKFEYYRNYFLGNDESKWKSKIHSVGQITQKNIYPNIDLVYEGLSDNLKYSFIVGPNTDPNQIVVAYEGADRIKIDRSGKLVIITSLGEIIESKPIAWAVDSEGNKQSVKVKFRLVDNQVSFDLGNYNEGQVLVIDPQLAFSTFTGATSDNWGFTACPDNGANLYAGGIVFGSGYPVTVGAFDQSYNSPSGGGTSNFDIAITKFNQTGNTNLFSTFLGGSDNEVPTSIVTNNNGDLFVLAITSSSNYPVSAGAVQTTFAGGPTTSATFLLFEGSDIAITRLNSSGTALLASTYLGGSNNDGLNYDSNLSYNYGDSFRGEIIVDNNGSVYFSSTTKSANFPVASTQSSLQGGQDAVYGKLPENLGVLNYCRYFGGAGFETGNGVQPGISGDLYITGGTTSNGLNFAQGGLNTNYFGNTDAYVIRVNGTTGALMNGTYLGTSLYDQGYFVQTDLDNNVYVFGQARGNYPQTGGIYGVPGSGQFIHKLDPDLSVSQWSTNIGSGSGNIEISPTAFLVSNCYEIYFAGWGGTTNSSNSLATQSSTQGFPTTAGAYQTNTNGNNFYLGVLAPDAAYLKYGTFMGGISQSANHVDGGTSRFSKEGTVYHAVCGSCGQSSTGFTTTPGVWATSAGSNNCNLAAFKFDLSIMEAAIGNTDPIICIPNPVQFVNNSANGNLFLWDFGDGGTSTAENPTYNYTQTGEYTVTLIVIDTNSCFYNDTVYFEVIIGSFNGAVTNPDGALCPGESVQLSASGGNFYEWSPAQFLDNPNVSDPIATVFEPTTFTVIVSDTCGADTLSVFVDVFQEDVEIQGPAIVCAGESAIYSVNEPNLTNMQWQPTAFFDTPNSNQIEFSPSDSITISFSALSANGCAISSSLFIQVDTTLPQINLPEEVFLCQGSSIQVTASGGNSYQWQDLPGISPLNSAQVTLSNTVSTWYFVEVFNACGSSIDSVFSEVIVPDINAFGDTIICIGEMVEVYATGGIFYQWHPEDFVLEAENNVALVQPDSSVYFVVEGTDSFGCVGLDSVLVEIFPIPFVQTNPDIYAFFGDPIILSAMASSSGTFQWSPFDKVLCSVCQQTTSDTEENTTFTVTFTDENGCIAQDDINVIFDALIYVPNTFTPDGDNFNPIFQVEGGNIREFHLTIFNRWGEVLFESYNFEIGWDGTYGGSICQDGTYIWTIEYVDYNYKRKKLLGHVNLLR